MTAREKLPERRDGRVIHFDFPVGSRHSYAVHYSCFADGRAAELFLSLYGKGASGSLLEAMGRDSAILASIALQSGVTLATLIEATTAETNGTATSVIGCALRLVRDALDGDPSDAPTSVLPMPRRGGDGAQEIPADVAPRASAGAGGAIDPPSNRAVDPLLVAS